MVDFKMNDEFIQRLSRVSSPISDYILNLKQVDQFSKDYVNFIGISRDNAMFISYLDKTRERKNAPTKRYIPDFGHEDTKIRFKRSAFLKYFSRGDIKSCSDPKRNHVHLDSKFPKKWNKKYSKEYTLKLTEGFRILLGRTNVVTFEEFKKKLIDKGKSEGWDNCYRFGNVIGLTSNNLYGQISPSNITLYHPIVNDIAYVKPGLRVEITDLRWNPDKRAHATSGKIVKRIIGKDFSKMFTEKQLTDFVSQFKYQGCREVGISGQFLYEEVEGEKIRWGYYEENYYAKSSSLGNSCMRYLYCSNFFDIYAYNTKHCSMGLLLVKDKIAARCLLWYPSGKEDLTKPKYFDRIYSMNDDSHNGLKVFLEKNGYKDCYGGVGKETPIHFQLEYGLDKIKYFPYMDSLSFITSNSILHNDAERKTRPSLHHLQKTGGGPINTWNIESDHEEDDEEVNNEITHCDCCESESNVNDLVVITTGRYRNNYLCSDCSIYCHDIDECVWEDDAVYDDVNEDYILKSNSRVLHDGRVTRRSEVVELFDGSYCHENEKTIISRLGNRYLLDTIDHYCIHYKGEWLDTYDEDVVQFEDKFYYYLDKTYIDLISQKARDEQEEQKQTEHIAITATVSDHSEVITPETANLQTSGQLQHV